MLRPGNAGDIEKFANLLDVTVVNFKEAGRHIVRKLVQKVERGMIAQYHRWIYDNHSWKSVETLKEFVLQEAESQRVAAETIRGANRGRSLLKKERDRTRLRQQTMHMVVFVLFEQFLWS